jgi:hypothetical protein
MEKKLGKEIVEILTKPLPAEAVQKHPSKSFLSTIKAIYVTERFNDAFGTGGWSTKVEHVTTQTGAKNDMVVVKVMFSVPKYDIYYEQFGGNDNADLGDAYKGAVTDAITKIGSYLGVGIDVFKGKAGRQAPAKQYTPAPAAPVQQKQVVVPTGAQRVQVLQKQLKQTTKGAPYVVVKVQTEDGQTIGANSFSATDIKDTPTSGDAVMEIYEERGYKKFKLVDKVH